MTEQELLQDCLRRLGGAGLGYMLVGSMAGNYWGIPRSTHDIDFVIQYQESDVKRIVALFEEDFFIQEISVRSALRPPHQFNAIDERSAFKVDFFRLSDDPYGKIQFERRRALTLFGEPAFIAAPEDVILYKFLWYTISPSERQLSDITGIWSVSGSELDLEHMRHWAKQLGVAQWMDRLERGELIPKAT
ncbi:MAG: hypothetical protein ABI619_11730 [Betaproteobacteria bacterium]